MHALLNFIHPDDREIYEASYRKMFRDHSVPEIEFRIIRTDRKVRYIRQKARLTNVGDEIIMAGMMQDVTINTLLEKKINAFTHTALLQDAATLQSDEVSGSATWIWDLGSDTIKWSESIYRLLKLKPQVELSHKKLLAMIHPEDQKKYSDELIVIRQQKKETSFEFRLIIAGEVRYIKNNFRSFQFEDKEYIIGAIHDISDFRNLQLQLNQRMQLAEALAENIDDKVIITDLDNQVIFWNPPCEKAIKAKGIENGKNFFELFPQVKNEEGLKNFSRVFKGESLKFSESKNSLFKGHHEVRMLPLWNEENKQVTGIFHVAHDLSRENELRKSLNERLSFIESIVESSVDQVIVLDKNLNYLVWNRQCEKYYGLKKSQVLGKNMLEVFPDTRKTPAYDDFRKALKGEMVYLPARPNSRKENYNEIYLIPVRNENEEIIAVLWILHDLSNEWDLQLQKNKMWNIIESLNECYLELDMEFSFTHINSVAEAFWNINKEVVIGKKITEILPSIKESDFFLAMARTMDERVPGRGKFLSPSTLRWIHASFAPTPEGMAVVFYDIHNIKEAEEAVVEREFLLQQINKATPDSITIYDLESKQPVYLNNCLAKWTGYSNEELVNMGMEGRLKIIHPMDRQRLIDFNESLLQSEDGEVKTIEYRVNGRKGEFWIRNRSKVFKRNSEGLPNQVLSVLQDVNKEVVLRKTLEERTVYAESIINSSIDQIRVVDRELKILAWNKQSEEVTGITVKNAIGKHLSEVLPMMRENPEILASFKTALEGEVVHFSPWKENPFGREESFFIPLSNCSGEVYAVLNIVHDVSDISAKNEELKKLNRELQLKHIELEQQHEEITNFSFVASHDLNEPLRKIFTFSDWLMTNEIEHLSPEGKMILNKLQASIKRMERLIQDILLLTKIHYEKSEPVEVNLNDVLSEVMEEMEERLSETHTKIEAGHLPTIMANRYQMFFLFRNLVSNAIKFQKPGNVPHLKISTSLSDNTPGNEEGKCFIKIVFRDNGFGFDNKYKQKIFGVFQRLHSITEFGGTGIGLAICKKIMNNLGGSIKVESEEGKGSSFICCFHQINK